MRRIYFFISLATLFSSCWSEDLNEPLELNVLEPGIANRVMKIDSVIQFPAFYYQKIHFTLNKSGIKRWDYVDKIFLTRSTGASSRINKDSSIYYDLATYPTGQNWLVIQLLGTNGELSAPSDTFKFIAN